MKDDVYEIKFVNAAAWLISRNCIETVGGFNPLFFLYGEDNDYLTRVKYHKFKVGVYPDANIYHDREDRMHNFYQENPQCHAEIKFLLNYCNPGGTADINVYVKNMERIRIPLRKALKLQFKESSRYKNEIRALKIKAEEINETRAIAKSIGLSFL